jgi:hypothetical protein
MANNFLMGGKLGDFLHAMYAVKQLSEVRAEPANVYMYDIGWEYGIQNTHAELQPILEQQSYINSLAILRNYELDPIQTPSQSTPIRVYDIELCMNGFIDLGGYIRSPFLYKNCWSEIYSKTFNFEISKDAAWISYPHIDENLQGKVLIHRRYNPIRLNKSFPYAELIEKYKDNIVFIGSSDQDYFNFPYKNDVEFYKISTLHQWFSAINTCEMIVSNLTAASVIAHSMDKKRIIELPTTPDATHCMGEEAYSKNIQWYLNKELNTVLDI